MDMTTRYSNRRTQFFDQPIIEKAAQQTSGIYADVATDSNSNIVSPLNINHGISKNSIIDFEFLQLYEHKIENSFEIIVAIPSNIISTDIDKFTISTNEVAVFVQTHFFAKIY